MFALAEAEDDSPAHGATCATDRYLGDSTRALSCRKAWLDDSSHVGGRLVASEARGSATKCCEHSAQVLCRTTGENILNFNCIV